MFPIDGTRIYAPPPGVKHEQEDISAVLRDIEAYMTARFPSFATIGDRAFCPTGEPYIVLGVAGIVEEGMGQQVVTTNMPKAVEMFKAEFDKYAEGKDGAIYWRRKPAVGVDAYGEGDFRSAFYKITARFVITDKPRLPDTKED